MSNAILELCSSEMEPNFWSQPIDVQIRAGVIRNLEVDRFER